MAQPGRRYLFTGGGTGGHVNPNLVMIDGIRKRDPSATILYVGHARGFERDAVPKRKIAIEFVRAAQFVSPRRTLAFIAMAVQIALGVIKSIGILLRFKPDLVIATGGYVSVPVTLAAALLGRRIFLHEQNALPGQANRFLARFAVRVGVSFHRALAYFPPPKGRVTGYPIAADVGRQSRSAARAQLGIPDEAKLLLVFGGSMGARSINRGVIDSVKGLLAKDERLIVIHSTGKTETAEYDAFKDTMQRVDELELTPEQRSRYRIFRYLDNLKEWYAACDLVVARSGAGAVMELGSVGRASILVPKLDVPGAHQRDNALVLEEAGAAIILEEQPSRENGHRISRLYADSLRTAVLGLLENQEEIRKMERAALRTVIPNALDTNLDEIELLAEGKPLLRLTDVQRETGFLIQGSTTHEVVFRSSTVGSHWGADIRIPELGDAVFDLIQDSENGRAKFTLVPRRGVVEIDNKPASHRVDIVAEQVIKAGSVRLVFMTEVRTFGMEETTPAIGRKAFVTAMGTMFSRVAGFLREAATAMTLGLSPVTDILTVGLRVSNFLRSVFAETAIDATFLPTFVQLLRSGRREEAFKLLGSVLRITVAFTSLATLIAIASASWWLPKVAPGFVGRGTMMEDAIHLTQILFPFLVLISVAALLSAVLRAFNRYAVAANASILYTVGVCVGLAFYDRFGIPALGVGVLLGGALQLLVQIPWVIGREIRSGWGLTFAKSDMKMPALRRVGRSTPNIVLDTVISRIGDIVDTVLATPLAAGTVSALYFGRILFQLPFAIVAQTVSTVVLKEFSEGLATKGRDWERRTIANAINWTVLLLVPLSVMLMMLGAPMVEFLFQWKRFTPEDVTRVSSALTAYSAGLLGWGLVAVTGRIFSAYGRLGLPTFVNACCLVVNVVLAIFLVNSRVGFTGIAWAATASFSLGAVIRTWLLHRHLASEGQHIDWQDVRRNFAHTMMAAGVCALTIFVSMRLVQQFDAFPTLVNRAFKLFVPTFFGGLAFVGVGFILNNPIVVAAMSRFLPSKGPTTDPGPVVAPQWLRPASRFLAWVENNKSNRGLLATYNFSSTVQEILDDPDWKTRNVAVKVIGILKMRSLRQRLLLIATERRPASALRRLLGADFAEPPFLRRNAIDALMQLELVDEALENTLVLALRDPYYECRSHAAKHLGDLAGHLSATGTKTIVGILRELARDTCNETACEAIRSLGKLDAHDDVIAFLRPFALHPNRLIREALISAYASLQGRGLFPKGAEGLQLVDEILLTSQGFTPMFSLRDALRRVRQHTETPVAPVLRPSEAKA